ncbi:hypothetical protein K1719_006238 [Acacia pycnantha]|nr:hypothetical protein K1719_006238 [Acacia pycnantha]
MADPTSSQPTAKERKIRENLLELFIKDCKDACKEKRFSDAICFGKRALQYGHELGNKEEAPDLHFILYSSYLAQFYRFHLQEGHSEEALENAKLALKHSKEVDEKFRMRISKSLALVFLEIQDFREALIHGEEWLSHFEENDDTDEKHYAQQTMTSAYHKRALNSLMNKQFKEASDDGEQALVYNRVDSIAIGIRWLLVRAYFSQEDFKNALEQFDREPDMLSRKLEVEDYIKAGKIHKKMRRYDKAIFYFEEAKKDANRQLKKKLNKWIHEVNQLIEEANESIQDDIPQMIEDIGEIDNEKHGNKKEIEEEQTFCHTEENIEKEASGDEGEPHTEDITKEQCEVLDAEKTPFFEKENDSFDYRIDKSSQISDECRLYKGSLKWMLPPNQDEWEQKDMICSVLEVKDEKTASYKGDINRKVDWWNHIEYDLRRLFGGVIKSISKLDPNSHGNLTRGIAVSKGQAKLFNMKPPAPRRMRIRAEMFCAELKMGNGAWAADRKYRSTRETFRIPKEIVEYGVELRCRLILEIGIEGYNNDVDCLLYMISNIVEGVHPDNFFDGLNVDYKKIRKLHCSKEFSIFLKCLIDRKDRIDDIYHPFFWPEYQQICFLERVYDLLWKDFQMEENSSHWNVVLRLEHCFSSQWNWANDIPSEGAFRGVFYYKNGPAWEMEHIPKVYAIAFWRHCKTHYNDHLAVGEKRKTVKEIHIELNKRFNILGRVFQAICSFIENSSNQRATNIYACNVKVKTIFLGVFSVHEVVILTLVCSLASPFAYCHQETKERGIGYDADTEHKTSNQNSVFTHSYLTDRTIPKANIFIATVVALNCNNSSES